MKDYRRFKKGQNGFSTDFSNNLVRILEKKYQNKYISS